MTRQEIPREVAIELCNQIRAENQRKRLSLAKLQCWGCYRFAKGDVEKMYLSSKQGCSLVNKRYSWQKEADNDR